VDKAANYPTTRSAQSHLARFCVNARRDKRISVRQDSLRNRDGVNAANRCRRRAQRLSPAAGRRRRQSLVRRLSAVRNLYQKSATSWTPCVLAVDRRSRTPIAESGGGDATEQTLRRFLSPERIAELDRFDRAQLADVLQVCASAGSLSEAGRRLFAISRQRRTTANDADRLRKLPRPLRPDLGGASGTSSLAAAVIRQLLKPRPRRTIMRPPASRGYGTRRGNPPGNRRGKYPGSFSLMIQMTNQIPTPNISVGFISRRP